MIKTIKLLFLFAPLGLLAAEGPAAPRGGTITGTVVDTLLQKPVEYANVVLQNSDDGAQITGTVSDEAGRFTLRNVKPGHYELTVNFIGYHKNIIEDVNISAENRTIELGTIPLKEAVLMLEGVETSAERAAVEYKIDKKVVNVSKQYTAASGSAVDVLENVPSVQVDIEGNVQLRGSGSFQVLIDGRPSILDAGDALKQIPASSIENIEIITNPSAKYDPDGTAGILNIVTKKNSMNGFNGMVTFNGGVNDKYGGDVLLNYRNSGLNAYVGLDYNHRFYPGTSEEQQETELGDTLSFLASTGDRERQFTSYGLRTGFDWNVTENDMIGIALRYGDRTFSMGSTRDFREWNIPGSIISNYTSLSDGERGGGYGSATLSYQHTFNSKDHKLTAELDYRYRDGDDISTDELRNGDGSIKSGRRSSEAGPGNRLRSKVDYTLPLNEDAKFEAGYQSRIGASTDETEFFEFVPETGNYEFRPQYSYVTEYSRDIHSLYALFADQHGKFGYQLGVRGEYTGRNVELVGESDEANIQRWDVFPTLHTSHQLSNDQQAMASYTRRIERPRGYYFEPFITWTDAYNVRRGNPGIKPEYIDSYETGFQRKLGKNLISLEGYYRITRNKVERVRSVYRENIMLHSVDNVGQDYMFGAELMFNVDAARWWNVNLMGNLFDYRIRGDLNGDSFDRSSFNWDARLNNTFKLKNSLRLQLNLSYNSPSVSAQGTREGFFVANIAARQAFLNDQLEVILQMRDVFSTARYEFTSSGRDFYTYAKFTRESPMLMLTINYLINNYQRERQGAAGGDMGGFEEM